MPKLLWKSYQGRLYTKFEENHVSHFRDMSEQTFMFFFFFSFFFLRLFALEKIALTCKLVLQLDRIWYTCRESRGNY